MLLEERYPRRHLRHLNEEYETPRYKRNHRRIDDEFGDYPRRHMSHLNEGFVNSSRKYLEKALAGDDTEGLTPDYSELYAGKSDEVNGVVFKIVHYLNNEPIFVSPTITSGAVSLSNFKMNILNSLKNKKFTIADLKKHLNREMDNPRAIIKTKNYSEAVLKGFLDFFYTKFLTGRYRLDLKESKLKMSEKEMLKLSRKIADMFDLDVD